MTVCIFLLVITVALAVGAKLGERRARYDHDRICAPAEAGEGQ